MNLFEIFSLIAIMLTLAAVPSASVALVVTRAATLGISNGIAVTVGIILGDLVFILLAIFGLSVIAEAMGGLFMIVKYIGAAYLLWLGFTLLRNRKPVQIEIGDRQQQRNLVASFMAGFLLTLGDIKAIIFYASLFPVFVDLPSLTLTDSLIIIAIMIFSIGSVKMLYAVSANRLAAYALQHQLGRATQRSAGMLLIGAGGYLMVKA